MIFPAIIGLWAWLFTETLTREGHIFSFLGKWADEMPEDIRPTLILPYKYITCGICHAGIVALLYAATEVYHNAPLSTLFVAPVIAMSVAKVMNLKF